MINAEMGGVWRLGSCIEAPRAHWDIPSTAHFQHPSRPHPEDTVSAPGLYYSVFSCLSFLTCEVGTAGVLISYCRCKDQMREQGKALGTQHSTNVRHTPFSECSPSLLFGRSVVSLCDPVDCSMPGSPVLHYLLEFTQTHVH